MNQQYKPGDVAMVAAANRSTPYRAFFDGKTWRETDEYAAFCVDSPTFVRPLLVIDPENEEQANALAKTLVEAMHAAGDVASAANGVHPATVAFALRSLLPVPEPEEPTGLGERVRDGNGKLWIQIGPDDYNGDSNWWLSARDHEYKRWSDLPRPLTVLSEGVQP